MVSDWSSDVCSSDLVCVCVVCVVCVPLQLQQPCRTLLLVAIMERISGWSGPASASLIVLYRSALAVPEGKRGSEEGGVRERNPVLNMLSGPSIRRIKKGPREKRGQRRRCSCHVF